MKIIIKESQFNKLFEDIQSIKQDKFIKRSQEKHKDSDGSPLYDYSLTDYEKATNKVKIICPKHKEEWKKITGNEYFEMTPNHHLSGKGCRFCYFDKMTKYSNEDILSAAKKYSRAIEFKNKDFNLWNAAIKKGKPFYDMVTSHFKIKNESFGEQLVTEILVKNGLITEDCISNKKCEYREKKFKNCLNKPKGQPYCSELSFDFYLPNENIAIEYDGEQHFSNRGKYGQKFETIKSNDLIKNKYCENNNIRLIRIHYKIPFDKVEEYLIDAINTNKQEILIGPY